MNQQATLLPRRTPPPEETDARRTRARLPPELLKKARSRLQFLAGLIVVLWVLSCISEYTLGAHNIQLLILYLAVLTVSGAIYQVCRSDRVSNGLALRLGLAYEVVICFLISTAFNWLNFMEHSAAPLITWSSIWIVVFPLITVPRFLRDVAEKDKATQG